MNALPSPSRASVGCVWWLHARPAWVRALRFTLMAGMLSASAPAPALQWNDAPVPGGVAGLAQVVGLEPATERWRVLYEVTRQAYAPYGEHSVGQRLPRALAAHFAMLAPLAPTPSVARASLGGRRDKGEARLPTVLPAPRSNSDARLPLPLPEALWAHALLERPPGPEGLVPALLGDRSAALVYRGLSALDEDTLQALAREPALLRALRDAAPAFSVFARSLSVRAGRVQVPGGAPYVALWERAVGAQVQRPARFIVRLAQRAEGRWFSLFDALQQLDERQREAVLGRPGESARRAAFETLADVFLAQHAWWQPGGRPYSRPVPDPALVLLALPCSARGDLSLPGTRAFWEAVFASDELPGDGAETLQRLATQPAIPLDGAWLVSQVARAEPGVARARLQSLRLAARLFADAPPSAALLTTLRGSARYPALLAALETLGFADPADFATALGRAQSLDALPSASGQVALTQFQGVLALLVRATRQHGVTAADAIVLARLLVALEPEREHGYRGRLLELLATRVLPRLAQAVYGNVPPDTAEHTVLRALAGARLDLPAGPTLEWEGLPYRVDAPGADLRRLQHLRDLQAGPTLDAALGLLQATRAHEARRSDAGRLTGVVAEALRLGASLHAEPRAHGPRRGAALAETLSEADGLPWAPFVALGRTPIGKPLEATRRLRDVADVLGADALRSLAYLPYLGMPDGPALLGGPVARRHVLGSATEAAGPGPWQLPEEVSGPRMRWHVRGSLLGLQDALARLHLRRLDRELPARPPRLHEPARAATARAAAALVAADLTDAQRDALAAALRTGRERLAAATHTPAQLVALGRAARLPAWRLRLLGWIGTHEPEALTSAFTLVELVRLGAPTLSADAWGVPAPQALGNEGLRLDADAWDLENLLGVSPLEPGAARASVDLHLRLAELFAELRLPAVLMPAVLSAAALDFQEEAQPAYPEDRLALARQASALTRERVEDYVAALALDGPLRPLDEAPATQPAGSVGGRSQ